MGQEKSTKGSRDQMTCAVLCACMQGGGNRKAGWTAGKGQKIPRTKPHSTTRGREAQSGQAAGERDGANKQTRDRGRHAKKKNTTTAQVTRWGKGTGNGGAGARKKDPPQVLKEAYHPSGKGREGSDQC